MENGQHRGDTYSHHYNDCPEFLKEYLGDELESLRVRLLQKINSRIEKLQKEFDSI